MGHGWLQAPVMPVMPGPGHAWGRLEGWWAFSSPVARLCGREQAAAAVVVCSEASLSRPGMSGS